MSDIGQNSFLRAGRNGAYRTSRLSCSESGLGGGAGLRRVSKGEKEDAGDLLGCAIFGLLSWRIFLYIIFGYGQYLLLLQVRVISICIPYPDSAGYSIVPASLVHIFRYLIYQLSFL